MISPRQQSLLLKMPSFLGQCRDKAEHCGEWLSPMNSWISPAALPVVSPVISPVACIFVYGLVCGLIHDLS